MGFEIYEVDALLRKFQTKEMNDRLIELTFSGIERQAILSESAKDGCSASMELVLVVAEDQDIVMRIDLTV